MDIRKVISTLIVFTLPLLSYAPQAQIYQWTDDSGKVHYADKDPNKDADNEDAGVNVKELETQPVNAYSGDASQPLTDKIEAAKAQREEQELQKVQQLAEETDAMVEAAEADREKHAAMNQEAEWEWKNGTVRNPAFNSSLTKTPKGDFILRTETTKCNTRTYKEDTEYEMNVNGSKARFSRVCIDSLISLVPYSMSDARTLDRHFSESTGSVDIGGVRYGTKGYK